MADGSFADFAADIKRATRQVNRFAEEMRESGIHVGLGSPPKCVVCEEAWPCKASQSDAEDEPS